jgi:hypothetical protein
MRRADEKAASRVSLNHISIVGGGLTRSEFEFGTERIRIACALAGCAMAKAAMSRATMTKTVLLSVGLFLEGMLFPTARPMAKVRDRSRHPREALR